jgi:hypothetical protein
MIRGKWHKIKMEVKLNTVGMQNGVLKIWVDDSLRFSASNFDYRDSEDIKIQAVLWDVHRGGTPQDGWVSSHDSYIDIANFSVREP